MDNFLDNSIVNTIDRGISKIQENFLQTEFGQVIDNSINVGLRVVLPDFIENQIINIKNSLFENGVKETINSAISSVLENGKIAEGIISGNFDNISQIEQAIKKGGFIDTFNSIIDKGLEFAKDKELVDKSTLNAIKNGKNVILKNLTKNIDEKLDSLIKDVDKLDNYCEKWQRAFENKNFNEMEKIYKSIERQLNKIVPLETIVEKAKNIENLQNLIKNNNGDFNLNEEELELARILV